MKKSIISMTVMALFAVMSASAQGIAFGIKGGPNISKMEIDDDAADSESGIGFFAGPTLKIDLLPFLGIQGAAYYEQTNSKVNGEKMKRQNVVVPLDARINLKLNENAGIYLATGPQFSFNVGGDDFEWDETSTYKNTFQLKKSLFSWNYGIGIILSKNFELGAVYSLGIAKTEDLKDEAEQAKANDSKIKPKSSNIQISVTLLF